MSASAIRAGEAFVELKIRDRLDQGIKGAQSKLDSLSRKATGLGAGIAATATSIIALPLKAASDMQETMAKFQTIFGSAAASMEVWADTTADAMGVSQQQMAEMLASFQDLLVPMGVAPAMAGDMSKAMSKLAIDLASFNNMNVDEVFQNLTSAIVGETEPMRKFGVVLSEALVKQELFNMGLDPKTIDNSAKAQARLNIIMRSTTAAQGDAIRTSDSFANQMKRLWAEINNASAAMGGAFIEDIASVVAVGSRAVAGIKSFFEANQQLTRSFGLLATSAIGVGAAIISIGVVAKATSIAIGVLSAVGTAAATAVSAAWYTARVAIALFEAKTIIASAIVMTAWRAVSTAVPVLWQAASTAMAAAAGVVSAAWTAASTAIGIAWKVTSAIVSTALVVGVIAAGASAVALAWGVSATTVAGAWITAGGAVVTAWTATTGAMATLAGLATAAWTGAVAWVSAGLAGLSAMFATVGLAGVASATASKIAWLAFSAITAAIAAKEAVVAAVLGTAWAAAGVVASAGWGLFIAALKYSLTISGAMTIAAFIAQASWATAAGIVTGAWTAAWTVITAPIFPFIAAIGAGVAAVSMLAAGAAIVALKGTDFGKAWSMASGILMNFAGIVSQTFSTIKAALAAEDYIAATRALWIGIQAIFWQGVDAVMQSMSWLWNESLAMAKRFFSALLDITWKSIKSIVAMNLNPLAAFNELQKGLASLGTIGSAFDPAARARDARLALIAEREQLEVARKRAEYERDIAELKKRESEIRGQVASGEITAEQGRAKIEDARKAFRDRQRNKAIDEAVSKGQITQERGDELKSSGGSAEMDDATKTFQDKAKALELEILALKEGEAAAERKRLADEGLTKVQIDQVMALRAKKEELEKIKKLEETQQQSRVDLLFKAADRLADQGVSPDEVFKRTMAAIDRAEKDGRFTKDSAEEARGRARDNLDAGMLQIEQEGRALMEALRTPQEKLNAELNRISKLQEAGAIDEKTALRAEDKARKDAADEMERLNKQAAREQMGSLDEAQKMVGPTGSFSAVAASIIGGSKSLEKESLKAQQEVAKNTGVLVKQSKKDNVARLG